MGKKRDPDAEEAGVDDPLAAVPEGGATDRKRKEGKKPKKDKSADEPEVVIAEVPSEGKPKGPRQPKQTADAARPSDGNAAAGGDLGGRRSRGTSNVPEETLKYLTELVEHFKTLTEGEEKELLVGNVLEELQGKEVLVAGDQVCSRHMETLLRGASHPQLLQFLQSVSGADGLQGLASSPFGSHVLEKVLVAIEKGLDGLDQEQYQAAEQLLTTVQANICEQLGAYITDRYATHVARRLLCVAAGRNVVPPTKQQRDQLAATMKGSSGLASRMAAPAQGATKGGGGGGGAADEVAQPRFPEVVLAAAKVLCREDYQGDSMCDITYSIHGAPYVQGLMQAMRFDRKALTSLLPCVLGAAYFNDSAKAGAVLEGVPQDKFMELVKDSTASHVVEVALQVAPPSVFEDIHTRFFQSNMSELCSHPSANYVVQAALIAAATPAQVKSMYEELAGRLGDLLKKRRSGVVAALFAACGNRSCCQKEVCAELEKALLSLPGWGSLTLEQALAPALLCLDSPIILGPNADPGVQGRAARLSPLGSSILVRILGFGQGACRQFTDSVAALKGTDAAKVGSDPSGSRVLEALLEGTAPQKVKQRLMNNLVGSFGKVCMTAAGSFLVERCYNWGDAEVKESIAKELVAAEKELHGTHWGPSLLKRVGAEAYARDPSQWRRHAEASQKAMAQFSSLFGGEDDKSGGKKKGKDKKAAAGKRDAAHGEGEKGASGGAEAAEGEERAPAGKGKGKRGRADKEGEEDEAGSKGEGKRAKGKREREVEEGEAGSLGEKGPELQGAAADVMATLGFGAAVGGHTGTSGSKKGQKKAKVKAEDGGERLGEGQGGGDELDALFAEAGASEGGKSKGKKGKKAKTEP